MPRDYGRVEYGKGEGKWRAIGYSGPHLRHEEKLGSFDTREEAVKRLQEHVKSERAKHHRLFR